MIQILGYREYFDKSKKIWAVKHMLFEVSAESIPDLFANSEKYLSQIPENERFNVHYTLADCYEAPRLFKSQTTIPFDLDDIDTNRISEYISLMVRELNVPFDEMGIAFSGHGLHFLVETDYKIQSEEELKSLKTSYKNLCKRIELKIKAANLPIKEVDPAVLKPAGTLRFPGSENRAFYKRDEHLPHKLFPSVMSYVINANIKVQDFKLLEISPVEIPERENVTAKELRQFPRPDTEFLLKECEFLKWNFEKPEEVVEPQWYAALSIVGVLPNGRDIAHQMSKGHPDYDYNTTDIKLAQAMEASGPRTCGNIDSLSDKCRSCKYFGQITSPILLRGPDYIKTVDTGFWEIEICKKTLKPKPARPAYEDLRRFYEKQYKYISVGDSKTIYTWKDTHWVEMGDTFIAGFAEHHMNPRPRNCHISEFLGTVWRNNQRLDSEFNESTIGRSNLANGVLKLDSMELEAHDPKYGFRSVLGHQYDPKATCPRFDKFLDEVTQGDKEKAAVLMEFAAYAFSGMPYVHHKALILTGEGANGKSTFLNVLKKLAGHSAYSSLMLNQLSQEYSLAFMVGKLFNVAEETPTRSLMDTSNFKNLSAGGSYMAREPYKKPIQVDNNTTKFIMACNELPALTDFSGGIERRFLIVSFDAVFKGAAVDPYLEEKLLEELPGIFNRVVEGYKRLIDQKGFTRLDSSDEHVKNYMNSHNSSYQFYDESVINAPGKWIECNDLFRAYVEWCKPMGIHPVTSNKFGVEIRKATKEHSISRLIDGKNKKVRENIKIISRNEGSF
jgi:P4 family phage/plasmid primase-like protien